MHAQLGHSPLVDWDDRQRSVVEADVSANLLVDAGPGTGKTAVACEFISRGVPNVLSINQTGWRAGTVKRVSFFLQRGNG